VSSATRFCDLTERMGHETKSDCRLNFLEAHLSKLGPRDCFSNQYDANCRLQLGHDKTIDESVQRKTDLNSRFNVDKILLTIRARSTAAHSSSRGKVMILSGATRDREHKSSVLYVLFVSSHVLMYMHAQ
jgi:hypothetical protein